MVASPVEPAVIRRMLKERLPRSCNHGVDPDTGNVLPARSRFLYPDLSVRKVLIYRTGSLGDTVIALPSFHQIARAFPLAMRVLLTQIPVHVKAPTAMAVLSNSGLVHGDIRYIGGTRDVREILRTIWKIRRFRADVMVHLMPRHSLKDLRRDRLFFRLAGARRIVGLAAFEELKHRFDQATGLYESEASCLARSIAELGDAHPEDIGNWNLHLNEAEAETAVHALSELAGKQLIVCGPGTKMQAKDWGQDNWRELLGRLYARYSSYGLVTIGAKEEAEVCEYAAFDWPGAKVNLSGMLLPRESAAVLSHATVFVGPDSGPMHLASSFGVPCVSVFSARMAPGMWFPNGLRNQVIFHPTECMGCQLETCVDMKKKCITSITVDEVERAVDLVLSQPMQPKCHCHSGAMCAAAMDGSGERDPGNR